MNRDIDTDMLIAHNKRLENENRVLRQTLWDDYFKSSMIGVLSSQGALNGMSATDFAKDSAEMADAMVSERMKRYGF